MSSVDDRIVEMQFKNTQFKQGAKESQQALEGVEKSITNVGKTKGLQQLADNVTHVTKKFSAMRIAEVAAIGTLASRATYGAVNFIKSFTLDPIIDGFKSMETQINASQTILANTGAPIGQITDQLGVLQKYAQQTIYSFADMTQNIGRFTAAGIKLRPAVADIKGIANVAALSGASAEEASRGMYQLSQALSSGVIKLQDWKSVEQANFASSKFRDALVETAHTMGDNGKAVDSAITKYGSFRASLTAGWLTNDVFSKTMKVMAGHIKKGTNETVAFSVATLKSMGYTQAQAEELNKLSEAAIQSASNIKTWSQLTAALKEEVAGGYANIFKELFGGLHTSTKLLTGLHNVLEGIFVNPLNGLAAFLHNFRELRGRANVLVGIHELFGSIADVIKTIAKAWQDVFPASKNPAGGLVVVAKAFHQFAAAMQPGKKTLEDLRDILGGFFAVIHIGFSVISALTGALFHLVGGLFGVFKSTKGAAQGPLDIAAAFGRLLKSVDAFLTHGDKLNKFFDFLGTTIGNTIAPALKYVGDLIDKFQPKIEKFINGLDFSKVKSPGDLFKSLFSGFSAKGALGSLKGIATQGASIAGDLISGLIQGLSHGGVSAMGKAVVNFGHSIIDGIKNVLGIHSPATTMIPVGQNIVMGVIKGIESALGPISSVFGKIMEGLGKGVSFITKKIGDLFSNFDALGTASFINALLSGVLILKITQLASSLQGVTDGFVSVLDGISGQLKQMQNELKAKAIQSLAIAIGIMAASLILLSLVKWPQLATGVGALGALAAILAYTFKVMSDVATAGGAKSIKGVIKQSVAMKALASSMILLAGAILILSAAVYILSGINMKDLAKGLGAIAIMMALLVASMRLVSEAASAKDIGGIVKTTPKLIAFGAAVVLMAAAMNLMAIAVATLGSMKFDTLKKGIGSIALLIGIMTTSLFALSKGGPAAEAGLFSAGAAMVAMATALNILVTAVFAFGNMDPKKMAKGFTAIFVLMTMMTASIYAIGATGPIAIGAGLALVALATSIAILVPIMLALGAVPFDIIGKGLLALTLLAVPILAIGAAATVTAPGLLALGGAMALVGLGMLAFGTGLAIVAGAGVAAFAVLSAGVSALLVLLPTFAVQLAAAFVSFVQVIAAASPKLRKSFDEIFKNLVGVITDNIPVIGRLLTRLITTFIDVVDHSLPHLLKLGEDLIHTFLSGVRNTVGDIVNTGLFVIDQFLSGLDKHIPRLVRKAGDIMVDFIDGLSADATKFVGAAGRAILSFLTAIDTAVNTYTEQIVDEGFKIGIDIIKGVAKGLVDVTGLSKITGAISHVTKLIPGFMRKKLDSNSPAKVMIPIGHDIIAGVAVGMRDQAPDLAKTAKDSANTLIDSFGRTVAKGAPKMTAWVKTLSKSAVKAFHEFTSSASGVQGSITDTLGRSNLIVSGGDTGVNSALAQNNAAQKAADLAQAKADAAQLALDKTKYGQKTKQYKQLQKQANNAAAAAQKAQDRADRAGNNLQFAQGLVGQDAADQANSYATQASDLATQSQELLAKANAEATKARTLTGAKNKAAREALLKAAAADAKAAQSLADQANSLQGQADTLAAQAEQARLDAEKLDTDTRIDAFNAKNSKNTGDLAALAAKEQAKADAKRAEAAKDVADATIAWANGDFDQASALLDLADTATSAADTAQGIADDANNTIADLLGTVVGATDPTNAASAITPSASVLEDAARSVDRWSASLTEAEQLASTDRGAPQFVQNNYSPKPLSTLDIYRQTKNLTSLPK